MIIRSRGRFVALFGLAAGLILPASSPGLAAQVGVATDLSGNWTGSFAKTDWTFQFVRTGDAWAGRYMSARTDKWKSLKAVSVVGDVVTFSLDSQPVVSFALTLNAGAKTLTGNAEFHGVKIPFAATRKA